MATVQEESPSGQASPVLHPGNPPSRRLLRENLPQVREEEEGPGEAPEAVAVPRWRVRSKPSTAARLPHFYWAWQQVTNNRFILNIVQNGYMIQFVTFPVQTKFFPRNMSRGTVNVCQAKVTEFLHKKIIKVVSPSHDQFVSHIFPVAKKTLGEYCIIFDLSDLNAFVRKISFRMDSISDIMNLIQPGDWFVSIDLSDAYYCIAMHILSMPFPTSRLWFHPLSYDSKVNTFLFIPNEIKIICFNRYELEISLLREESSFYLCSKLIPQRCRHSMQVLDEVPMIWGSCYMVYTMHMVGIIS